VIPLNEVEALGASRDPTAEGREPSRPCCLLAGVATLAATSDEMVTRVPIWQGDRPEAVLVAKGWAIACTWRRLLTRAKGISGASGGCGRRQCVARRESPIAEPPGEWRRGVNGEGNGETGAVNLMGSFAKRLPRRFASEKIKIWLGLLHPRQSRFGTVEGKE
jgi:hypothetical protein